MTVLMRVITAEVHRVSDRALQAMGEVIRGTLAGSTFPITAGPFAILAGWCAAGLTSWKAPVSPLKPRVKADATPVRQMDATLSPGTELQIEVAQDGFQALLRWRHPELGELTPAHFLRLAEHRGALPAIESWLLRQTAAMLRRPRVWAPLRASAMAQLSTWPPPARRSPGMPGSTARSMGSCRGQRRPAKRTAQRAIHGIHHHRDRLGWYRSGLENVSNRFVDRKNTISEF